MNKYVAYGLRIDSDLRLPELEPSDHVVSEVQIRHRVLPSAAVLRDQFSCSPECALFEWESVGRFRVSKGTDIFVEIRRDVEERLVRLPLLGTVLAALLHQRGLLALHASAVAVNGRVAVFLGDKGGGKSTTAAALYRRGHTLITDDVLAIRPDGIDTRVVPGFPQFKLTPASVRALGEDPTRLRPLSRHSTKRARLAQDRFRAQAVLPIGTIYVLDRGPHLELVDVAPQQAFAELLRYTYNVLQLRRTPEADRAVLLKQYADLAGHVSVKYLRRTDDLGALSDIATLVESDLNEEGRRGQADQTTGAEETRSVYG